MFRFGDPGFFEGGFLGETAQGDSSFGGRGDDSGERATVFQFENGHTVFGGNDGAGIYDIFQQVAEVGAAGAGKVGAEFAAFAVEDVTGSTEILEEDTPGREIGFVAEVFAESLMKFFDAFLFGGIGLAKVAPDFFEAGGELLIVQGEGLTGVEGREIVARDDGIFDFGKEGVGPGGSCDDNIHHGSFFIRPKIGVVIEERLRDGGIVKGGEPADSGFVEVTNLEKLFANVAEIVGAGIDEALQCGLAVVEGRVVVEGDLFQGIHGATIAEEYGKIADELGVVGGKFVDGGGPVFRKGSFSPAFEALGKSLEDVRSFGGLLDGEVDDGVWIRCQRAGDVAKKVGPLGGFGDIDEFVGMVFEKRSESEPDELGKVVVVRGVSYCKSCCHCCPSFKGDSLKSRGDCELRG